MSTASEDAVKLLQARGVDHKIEFGLVLGTGLGPLAEAVENPITVPYSDLPGFPIGNVSGHAGMLVIGRLEGTPVALMQGRSHFYEKGDARSMATGLETFARLGAQAVLLTNSAGSLHPDWHPGSLAVIADHINFSGVNPLIGVASDERFVSLNNAYDQLLRQRLKRASATASLSLREGVYMWFSGPSFETPAEIRMAGTMGADLVGMSTVPEVILARYFGLRVAAISLVTNLAAGIAGAEPSHAETKEIALAGAAALRRLIAAFLRTNDV
jgi:purine-nucleoside phosphorylase